MEQSALGAFALLALAPEAQSEAAAAIIQEYHEIRELGRAQ
jgi:hypothetical protein